MALEAGFAKWIITWLEAKKRTQEIKDAKPDLEEAQERKYKDVGIVPIKEDGN